MTGRGEALRDLAAEAFIYGYPLVAGVAGEHHPAGHARELVTAKEARTGGVVSPNVDTLSGGHDIEVGCLDPLATAYQFEVDLAVAHCAGVPG